MARHRDSHERAFFLYDHQKHGEEADPKDAILYFYPPAVDIEEQIALVGGIIGTVDFCMDVLGYTPSVVSLTTCRFALLKTGPFILGLSSELQAPEQYVTQHLQFLWNTFCLYQGSLLAVRQRTGIDGFTLELNRIWNSYFSLCQSFSDQLSQAFGVIPYRDLSLAQSHVFLEASHILQRAENCTGVIGGALFNRNRVLCTQLSSELTRRLLVLMPSEKNFPCIEVKPAFELPGGVRLLSAFVTAEELSALGPRKRGKSGERRTHIQDTELKTSPSSSFSPSAPSSPPQQPQLQHQQQQQPQSARPSYGLSAVVESAEIRDEGEGEEFQDSEAAESAFESLEPESGLPMTDQPDERTNDGWVKEESQSASETMTSVSDASNGGASDKPATKSDKIVTDTVLTEKIDTDPKNLSSDKQTDWQQERTETSIDETAVLHDKDEDGSCKDGDVKQKNRNSGDFSSAEDGAPDSERTGQISTDKRTDGDINSSPAVEPSGDEDSYSQEGCENRESACASRSEVSQNLSDLESGKSSKEGEEANAAARTVTDNVSAGRFGNPTDSVLDADGGEEASLRAHRRSASSEAGASRHSEDDGNSHLVADEDCADSYTSNRDSLTETSSSSVVASHDDSLTSPGSVASSPTNLPLDISPSTPTGDDDYLLPDFNQSLGSPQTQVVHFDSLTKSIELSQDDSVNQRTKEGGNVHQGNADSSARRQTSEETSSVPLDRELQLDFIRSGASSVLTISDEMMSPNKERLNFETTLQNSGSSGSGSATQTQPFVPLELLREYSTEPSSSDIARSLENVSALSSSSTLLSSPSAGPSVRGSSVDDVGLEGRKEVLLYVQGHMDTLLVLLLDDLSQATKDNVNILWKSSLAKLAELDYAVSDTTGNRADDSASGRSYLYLKYDSSSQAMQGTAKTAVTSLANELVSSSIQLHDTFCRMPASSDILCRTHTTCCYGHKTMTSETFFQVQATKGGGYPDPQNIAFSLDQFADRKLYTDHSTALL
ncbi:serine-rich adhesin for platelets-like [Littorina saxatilis]|uniref:serine-rich adhesin for platelets-like n=1 Tax=Littorina saxatilis TaxID=31220 RepID=UPI0038B4A9D4